MTNNLSHSLFDLFPEMQCVILALAWMSSLLSAAGAALRVTLLTNMCHLGNVSTGTHCRSGWHSHTTSDEAFSHSCLTGSEEGGGRVRVGD